MPYFIKIIKKSRKAPISLWHSFVRLFSDKFVDKKEEERIDALARNIIHFSNLLDQKKFIPHGPAYNQLPDMTDLP